MILTLSLIVMINDKLGSQGENGFGVVREETSSCLEINWKNEGQDKRMSMRKLSKRGWEERSGLRRGRGTYRTPRIGSGAWRTMPNTYRMPPDVAVRYQLLHLSVLPSFAFPRGFSRVCREQVYNIRLAICIYRYRARCVHWWPCLTLFARENEKFDTHYVVCHCYWRNYMKFFAIPYYTILLYTSSCLACLSFKSHH